MIIVYSLIGICVITAIYFFVNLLLHKKSNLTELNRHELSVECARAVEEVIFNNHSKSISRSIIDAEQVLERHNLKFSYLNVMDNELS